MNLYWVTTEDHAEDWFVVANNAEEAEPFMKMQKDICLGTQQPK